MTKIKTLWKLNHFCLWKTTVFAFQSILTSFIPKIFVQHIHLGCLWFFKYTICFAFGFARKLLLKDRPEHSKCITIFIEMKCWWLFNICSDPGLNVYYSFGTTANMTVLEQLPVYTFQNIKYVQWGNFREHMHRRYVMKDTFCQNLYTFSTILLVCV